MLKLLFLIYLTVLLFFVISLFRGDKPKVKAPASPQVRQRLLAGFMMLIVAALAGLVCLRHYIQSHLILAEDTPENIQKAYLASTRFRYRCEYSGGTFLDCSAAFAEICRDAAFVAGRRVACSCPEGKSWIPEEGCR